MFLWIAEQLGFPGVLNLFRYITFRAGGATATALFIGLLIGPRFIGWLRSELNANAHCARTSAAQEMARRSGLWFGMVAGQQDPMDIGQQLQGLQSQVGPHADAVDDAPGFGDRGQGGGLHGFSLCRG